MKQESFAETLHELSDVLDLCAIFSGKLWYDNVFSSIKMNVDP